jgi:heptosyltransferase I
LAIIFIHMSSLQPNSILIVKTSAIGDVIQTFPALEYLRLKFPEARIDWVTEKGIVPLLQAHPQVNNVFAIHTKAWKAAPLSLETRVEIKAFAAKLRSTTYDLLFDCQGNTKSAFVTGLAKARVKVGFDWKCVREKSNLLVTNKRISVPMNLNIRLKYLGLVQGYFNDPSEFAVRGVRLLINNEEEQRLAQICQNLSRQPRLMVCFGSKWTNKRMQTSTLASFLQKIAANSDFSFLFIFGDDEEKRIAKELSAQFNERSVAVGGLSLPLWQALMWEMDGIIAVDSAALHLCGTTQTPSFSLFGPTMASYFKPMEERHGFFQGSCPYGRTFSSHCPILRTCTTGACIRQLEAEHLFRSFKEWSQLQNLPLLKNR